MIDRPPCWPEGQRCPNNCAKQHHERTVNGSTPLYGPWTGWRMAGRFLISPGRLRAVPEQLAHLMFMASLTDRTSGLRGVDSGPKKADRILTAFSTLGAGG